jgi:ribosomal protein S2
MICYSIKNLSRFNFVYGGAARDILLDVSATPFLICNRNNFYVIDVLFFLNSLKKMLFIVQSLAFKKQNFLLLNEGGFNFNDSLKKKLEFFSKKYFFKFITLKKKNYININRKYLVMNEIKNDLIFNHKLILSFNKYNKKILRFFRLNKWGAVDRNFIKDKFLYFSLNNFFKKLFKEKYFVPEKNLFTIKRKFFNFIISKINILLYFLIFLLDKKLRRKFSYNSLDDLYVFYKSLKRFFFNYLYYFLINIKYKSNNIYFLSDSFNFIKLKLSKQFHLNFSKHRKYFSNLLNNYKNNFYLLVNLENIRKIFIKFAENYSYRQKIALKFNFFSKLLKNLSLLQSFFRLKNKNIKYLNIYSKLRFDMVAAFKYKNINFLNLYFYSENWINGSLTNYYGIKNNKLNFDKFPEIFLFIFMSNYSGFLREANFLGIFLIAFLDLYKNFDYAQYYLPTNSSSKDLNFFYSSLLVEAMLRGFMLNLNHF